MNGNLRAFGGIVAAGSVAIVSTTGAIAALTDVEVLHAGSLITLFQKGLGPAFNRLGYHLESEGRGSVANANMIKDGLRAPDVFISADDQVMADLAHAAPDKVSWYLPFATTRIVVAFSQRSRFLSVLDDAAHGKRSWTQVLAEPGLKIGRTDPAIDPKGYRTIIVCKLAERHYGIPGFQQRLLGEPRNPQQTFTDEGILLRLEEGELDAAFVYSTEAVSRRLPMIELPGAINLGEPRYAALYSTQNVTINGVVRTGAPIQYAITVPRVAKNPSGGAAFVEFLLNAQGGTLLREAGLGAIPFHIVGDTANLPALLRKYR